MTIVLQTLHDSIPPPIAPLAGIQTVRATWHVPLNNTFNLPTWAPNLTTRIRPLPLQSHNDFERLHPLFDALSVGCTAFAADLPQYDYSDDDDAVYVGHSSRAIETTFTLQNLSLIHI